jgi:hypothetical protein
MAMKHRWTGIQVLPFCVLAVALPGCGGEGNGASPEQRSAAVTDAAGSSVDVCALLTSEQVSTVLPGHDGGEVEHSGGSLLKGVDAYQCSYTAISGSDIRLLTVILNVASTDELFAEIKPTGFARGKEEAISLGDGGWSRGDERDWKITVMKGRTVIDLELMAPAANEQSAQLLELARSVVEKT